MRGASPHGLGVASFPGGVPTARCRGLRWIQCLADPRKDGSQTNTPTANRPAPSTARPGNTCVIRGARCRTNSLATIARHYGAPVTRRPLTDNQTHATQTDIRHRRVTYTQTHAHTARTCKGNCAHAHAHVMSHTRTRATRPIANAYRDKGWGRVTE